MLHNTRTRSPLFYISAMGASQVQAAQRHTAVATDRKDGQDTAPPAPVTKLGIEAWLRPTPQHPNRSSIWRMTAILPLSTSCAGNLDSSVQENWGGLNPRTLDVKLGDRKKDVTLAQGFA